MEWNLRPSSSGGIWLGKQDAATAGRCDESASITIVFLGTVR